MAKAFVVGATGYTGRSVVEALCRRGERVIAHVRPDSPRLAMWRERFATLGAEVDTTPFERDAMRATLSGVSPDLVFALLGTTRARARRSGDPGETHEAIDYGLTSLLLDATARAAASIEPPPRFVYLSSIGAGPKSGAYLRARWKIESELAESGLPSVIARPSFITGSDRDESRPGERFAARLINGAAAVVGALGARRARGRWRSITGPELAEGLVAAALDPEADGAVLSSHELRAYARS